MIPSQASIARSDTVRSRLPADDDGDGFAAEHAPAAAQHDAAGAGRGGAARVSAARTAASQPRARAQASRSAGEWQQQLVKHCSAVAHPQVLSMQGKGRERSLPARRHEAAGSTRTAPRSAGRLPKGRGSPDATTV